MRLENVVIDCRDEQALGRWWAEALGWVYVEDGSEVCVRERVEADGSYPYPELIFGRDEDPGAGQERVHLDLNSHSLEEQRATVERLLTIGARLADVGQPSMPRSWSWPTPRATTSASSTLGPSSPTSARWPATPSPPTTPRPSRTCG